LRNAKPPPRVRFSRRRFSCYPGLRLRLHLCRFTHPGITRPASPSPDCYLAVAEVPGPFLAKPFAPDDLLCTVRLLIAGYHRLSLT